MKHFSSTDRGRGDYNSNSNDTTKLLHSKNAFVAVLCHYDWNWAFANHNMGCQLFLKESSTED